MANVLHASETSIVHDVGSSNIVFRRGSYDEGTLL